MQRPSESLFQTAFCSYRRFRRPATQRPGDKRLSGYDTVACVMSCTSTLAVNQLSVTAAFEQSRFRVLSACYRYIRVR